MTAPQQSDAGDRTLDSEEVERFSKLASEWWNPRGKFRPLHQIGPPRLSFISHGTDPGDVLKCVELGGEGRLRLLDGDCDDLLPGIDVRSAFDTHSFGSMFVIVRNDGLRNSEDRWVLAGDLVYVYENMGGNGSAEGVAGPYVPVGFAIGSQANLILTTEKIVAAAGGNLRRVVPMHEDRLHEHFPTRAWDDGLRVSEICLADDEPSRLG